MSTLFTLMMPWRKTGQISFNKTELSQIMALYGERVSKGEWRDYALDCQKDIALFSIFRHSHETPLYTISKRHSAQKSQSARYSLDITGKTLKQSHTLADIIDTLRDHKI